MRMRLAIASLLVAAMAVAAGCGSDSSDTGSAGPGSGGSSLPTSIGQGEGALNLIAWQGYTEPNVVKPFEKESGCKVTVKYAGTSDQMINLMRSGGGANYDGVSASGNASNTLIAGGDVAAINPDLIPDFKNISPALQSPPNNTVDGVHYGVAYQWGANVLMWNPKVVKPDPTSWAPVFDGTSYKGKVTAYNDPIYIADAAVYLKAHNPDLKITDPYELTSDQLDAAVALLEKQRQQIGNYWSDFNAQITDFANGTIVIGTTWPYQVNVLKEKGMKATLPEEGATGWSDTWMMSAHAPHPNCMMKWMAYATAPAAQAKTAYTFGSAPANPKACANLEKLQANYCTDYHVTDQNYFDNIAFWKTPIPDCGDDRGQTCTSYQEWTTRWEQIKG